LKEKSKFKKNEKKNVDRKKLKTNLMMIALSSMLIFDIYKK